MQTITDWETLWKELVAVKLDVQKDSIETPGDSDIWSTKAREFNDRVKVRWEKPDSTREFVLSVLEPNASILDIGAGTGAWSLLFSKAVERVTAIEPSKAMRQVLCENIKNGGINNIKVLPDKWPESDPEMHDYSFCSHAMYGSADFRAFVQRMMDRSRKMCFLLIRAPSTDGLITEAFQTIYRQPHDSPNFTIAYNILIQMGIYANVLMEQPSRQFFLSSVSVEEAFIELKRRMGLANNSNYDTYLRELLERRLVRQDGQYCWPGGSQSGLIYWKIS